MKISFTLKIIDVLLPALHGTIINPNKITHLDGSVVKVTHNYKQPSLPRPHCNYTTVVRHRGELVDVEVRDCGSQAVVLETVTVLEP